MTELKCKNCNSSDFEYLDGIWVCNSCGTKYIPDKLDIPQKSKEDKLAEELLKLIRMDEDIDYVSTLFDHPPKLEKYIHKIETVANQLEEINSKNPYASTAQARLIPLIGNWSEITADLFIFNIEDAIEHITKNDRIIWERLEEDFSTYKDKVLEYNPGCRERIDKLDKEFKKGFLYS